MNSENEDARRISEFLGAVTRVVPVDGIDIDFLGHAYDAYASRTPLFSARELAIVAADRVTLVGRTKERLAKLAPAAQLLWLWPNALAPTWSWSFWWLRDVRRGFFDWNSPEFNLLRTRPVHVVILLNARCAGALEINLPAVDPELWSILEPAGSFVGDRPGGKAYALANLGDLAEDPLCRSWVERIEGEASRIMRTAGEAVKDSGFLAERSHIRSTSLWPSLENADSLVGGVYGFLTASASDPNGPVLALVRLRGELESAPLHCELVENVFRVWWFSGQATGCGHAVPSIEDWPDNDSSGEFAHHITPISLELHRDLASEFWRRTPLVIPFFFRQTVGRRDIPVDLVEFITTVPRYTGDPETADAHTSDLFAEARTLKQWTIPHGAYVQLDAGPLKALRLFEIGQEVQALFINQRGEYLHASVDPRHGDIAIPIEVSQDTCFPRLAADHRNATPEEAYRLVEEIRRGLKLILASVIRDFWVVEDRHTVFGRGLMTRKGTRLRSDNGIPVLVYLPRIRYVSDCGDRPAALELAARRPHFVVGHLRKALHATGRQILAAQRYGIRVPEGFTFVAPHRRGHLAGLRLPDERNRIYRSRSALACIHALDTRGLGSERDEWFTYELQVRDWLSGQGFVVDHLSASRRGDGGVDLQASKGNEFLLIQCKYWRTAKVGPSVVRELLGGLKSFPSGSRGVIVTSSELTPGARMLAQEAGVQFIERIDFSAKLDYPLRPT